MINLSNVSSAPFSNNSVDLTQVDSLIKAGKNSSNLDFKEILVESQVSVNNTLLKELLNKIEKQEAILLQSPSTHNLNEYKVLVRDFMGIAANNYKIAKINIVSNEGYKKVLHNSDIVDAKLNELTEYYLDDSKKSIDAISSFVDIKGLLVDMLI